MMNKIVKQEKRRKAIVGGKIMEHCHRDLNKEKIVIYKNLNKNLSINQKIVNQVPLVFVNVTHNS